jgi:hypothetical protein
LPMLLIYCISVNGILIPCDGTSPRAKKAICLEF